MIPSDARYVKQLQLKMTLGNAGGNIPDDLAELIKLWPLVSDQTKAECMATLRVSAEWSTDAKTPERF